MSEVPSIVTGKEKLRVWKHPDRETWSGFVKFKVLKYVQRMRESVKFQDLKHLDSANKELREEGFNAIEALMGLFSENVVEMDIVHRNTGEKFTCIDDLLEGVTSGDATKFLMEAASGIVNGSVLSKE